MSARSVGSLLFGIVALIVVVIVVLAVAGMIRFQRDDSGAQIHVETERLEELGRDAAQETGKVLERAGQQLQESSRSE